MAAKADRFDGFVALGCVLRGETSHYDIVANESARGLVDLTMKGLCIGNGILTCENEQQAMARARVSEMDKGGGAAEAALAMVRLRRRIGSKDKHR
jgi:6,7-dimethyl-8-ribityllumazine synthase